MRYPHRSPTRRRLDEDRLVWIMGSSRSGSTWLLRMLGELEEVVTIDDPHLGHHLGVWRPISLAWATADEPPELTTLAELKRDKPSFFFADRYAEVWRPALRELIAARFAAQAAEAGVRRPRVVVKEPGSQAAGLVLSLFPRSRLIFLLRDGRDVIDSWLAAYRAGAWAQEEGAFPLAAFGREAFIRWQASVWAHRANAVARAYESHDPARRILIRYEELRADPVGSLERTCRAAGIRADAEQLARISAIHDIDAMDADAKGPHRPIRSGWPGGWRRSLSAGERRTMLDAMGSELVRFGYLQPGELRRSRWRLRRAA
jgi:Sulfotransferase family